MDIGYEVTSRDKIDKIDKIDIIDKIDKSKIDKNLK